MHGVCDWLALDRLSQQPGKTLYIALTHAIARHFLHADTQTRRVAWIRIARQQIVVDDNIVRLEALRHGYSTPVCCHIDRNLVTRRIAKIPCFYPDTLVIQRPPEGLRIADDLRGVGGRMLAHLPDGYEQRRQRMQVVVTRRTREHPTVGRGPVLPLIIFVQIRHDHPTLWARKRFVRARGHPCGAFAPGILELTAYDQPKYMRS